MKKITHILLSLQLTLLFLLGGIGSLYAQCVDNTGLIAFTSYQIADGGNPQGQSDRFSFVALDSIPPNTPIRFTDRGFTGGNTFQTFTNAVTDGDFSWSHSSGISPGTHIVITLGSGTATASVGGVTDYQGNFNLGLAGDQLFGYTVSPSFKIHAAMLINKSAWDADMTEFGNPIVTSSRSLNPGIAPRQSVSVFNAQEDAYQAKLNPITLTGDRTVLRSQLFAGTFTISNSLNSDGVNLSVSPITWNASVPTYTPISLNNKTLSSTVTDACYIQWQSSTDGVNFTNISDGTAFSGTKTASLTINTPLTQNTYFRMHLTGAAYTVTDAIHLRLPVVTNHPPNRTICVGTNTSFSATAIGTALQYQWQVDNGSGFTDISNGGVYSGATTATLNVSGAPATMNDYQYRLRVYSSIAEPVRSNSATLTVINIQTITSHTNVSCFDGNDGTATVSNPTGGIAPYTYSWIRQGASDVLATTQSISDLTAGTYTVTITDHTGCSIARNIIITEPTAPLEVSLNSQNNVSCNGGSNGTASVTAAGGTAPYTYSWMPNVSTSASASGLSAGIYTVTVTDANNCTAQLNITITQPDALVALPVAQTNVACHGEASGSATVSVRGGTGAYTYSWAPSGGTAATATGLTAGTYTVTVTDANNCQTTQDFTITQPAAPVVASVGSQTNVSCFGASDGEASVSVSGGTAAYTYSWVRQGESTVLSTSEIASNLSAGIYIVTVTDANGCIATQSFIITQPSLLEAAVSIATNVSSYGGNDGAIEITVTGGTLPYSYNWYKDGATTAFTTTKDVTDLTAGSYKVTVTDSKGCTAEQNITITQPAFIPVISSSSTGNLQYTENGAPVVWDAGVTITDHDSPTLASASIFIRGGLSTEDVLTFTKDDATMGNIQAVFSGNLMGLSSAGATATLAEWQYALRAVTYHNTSEEPGTQLRELALTVNDGVNTSVEYARQLNVLSVNDAPTLSATALNPTFTEGDATVALFSGANSSTIENGQKFTQLVLTASGVVDAANHEYLRIGTGDSHYTFGITGTPINGITKTKDPVSGVITVTIDFPTPVTAAELNSWVNNFGYIHYGANPTPSPRVFTLTALQDDGGTANGGVDTRALSIVSTVTVVAVNDAPIITAPATIAVVEDVQTPLTGISFSDVDAGAAAVTATFSVPSGSLSAVSGSDVTVGGTASAVTLTGTIADINAFVASGNVAFTTAINATVNVPLTIAINDNGNSGTGSNLSDSRIITLLVTAVNDAPVLTVPTTQTIDQDETLIFHTADNNRIVVSDVDAGTSAIQLTLTATNGSLTLAGTTGLSFLAGSGTNDAMLVFEGTLAAINTALEGLQFKPANGYNGPASLAITVNDKGATGSDGALTDTKTLSIIVNPLNPVITGVSSSAADGLYGIDQTINIAVTFDQVVHVHGTDGAPTLLLETGLTDRNAVYEGGSGSNTLTFNYTVQEGDVSVDLDYNSTSALALNGVALRNNIGKDAILTLPLPAAVGSLGANKNLVIDGIRPVITLDINGGALYTNNPNVTLTLSTTDTDITTMRFSNDGTDYSTAETFATNKAWELTSGDGLKTVYMQVVDHVANASTVVQKSITLDQSSPIVGGISNGGIYNDNRTITFNEGNATLNGASFNNGTVVSAEGSYTLVVTDPAGNVTTVSFEIDKTVPVVMGVSDGGIYTDDRTVTFNEGNATLNGTSFNSGDVVSAEGGYTLVVTDVAGNITTVGFAIDKTAPAIPLGLTASPSAGNISLQWTANQEADLAAYHIYAGTLANQLSLLTVIPAGTTTHIDGPLTMGQRYYYAISAVDALGNESQHSTVVDAMPQDIQTITFDALADRTFGEAPFALIATASSGLSITYSSSDNNIASISGNVLTIHQTGDVEITASQNGNEAFLAAAPVTQSLHIRKASLTGITLADATYTYDGTAKSLAVAGTLPVGVTVSYANNGQVNAGAYTVTANMDGGTNYEDQTLTAELTIEKAVLTGITLADATYTYDGTAKSLTIAGTLPNGVTVSYDNNEQVNAGTYIVTANIDGGTNYEDQTLSATMTIEKADLTGITLTDATHTYDGTAKSLEVNGTLPNGVTVSYDNNGQVNAGTYIVTANIDGGTNYEDQTLSATMIIEKADLTGITLTGDTHTYDGTAKSLTIAGTLPNGVTVSYNNNGQVNAGTYIVTANIDGGTNYEDQTLRATLTIEKADLTGITLTDATHTYDGTAKSLTIAGTLPNGVTVSYDNNGQVNAGTYIVTANIDGGTNYEDQTLSATLTIEKADLTGITLTDATYTYDGTAKSLAVAGTLPAGVTVTYANNGQVNAGAYTVTANMDGGTNFEDQTLTAELTIEKAVITGITLEDATYTYDGTAKSLAVVGTLSNGVTVSYTNNGQVNAGTYIVTANIDGGTNYEGQTLRATLTIEKADLTAITLTDATYTYDGTAKSLTIAGTLPNGIVVVYDNNGQIDVGEYTVTATIAETENHTGLRLQALLTIRKASQTITFTSPGTLARDAGSVALDVRSDSDLPVVLSVDDDMVARINGTNLEVLRLGTVVITATQVGSENYEAAEPVSVTVRVANDANAPLPIRVHQAVSPNGDGINEFLIMEGIRDYPENKVTIFDKSGKVIEVIEGYNNGDRVFTGQFVNDGTYYYYIDVKDGGVWKREKGFFVVKRSVN